MMESFFKEAQSQFETLEVMFKKMTDAYKDLSEFFAFDPNKYPLGEFFTDLRTFAAQFQQCVEENRRARETEEKIRRAEEDRAAREKEREARKNQKERLMASGAGGPTSAKSGSMMNSAGATSEMADTGVMDNLYIRFFYILRFAKFKNKSLRPFKRVSTMVKKYNELINDKKKSFPDRKKVFKGF